MLSTTYIRSVWILGEHLLMDFTDGYTALRRAHGSFPAEEARLLGHRSTPFPEGFIVSPSISGFHLPFPVSVPEKRVLDVRRQLYRRR